MDGAQVRRLVMMPLKRRFRWAPLPRNIADAMRDTAENALHFPAVLRCQTYLALTPVVIFSAPGQKHIDSEVRRMSELIRSANIQAD